LRMARELKKMKPRKAADDSAERRLKTIAVVVVVCLVLVVGIVVATGSSKSKKIQIKAQTSAPASSTPAQQETIESVQVPPLSVYRRRNIFKPLVNMEAGQQVTASTTTAPGAGGAGPGVITLPPELDPSGREAGSVISTALTLEGVVEQGGKLYARLRIGDTLFEKVAVGDVFGGSYKLLSLGKDSSATVLYGDERFTIFAGQSLYW
jgi:hypothetical protein